MEVFDIVEAAVGKVDISLLSGASPLVNADFIVQEEPLIFSGLYYKAKDVYIFVITKEGFESSLITE